MVLFISVSCPKSKHPIKIWSQDNDIKLKILQYVFFFYTHNNKYTS